MKNNDKSFYKFKFTKNYEESNCHYLKTEVFITKY